MKLLIFLLIPLFLFAHGGEKHEEKKSLEVKIEVQETKREAYTSINKEYIKNIKPIFQKKCFDCHSNQTNYPWYFKLPLISDLIKKDIKEAKEHLDFSNDFPFISHGTPKKDLISILDVARKKSMPPLRYAIVHRNSKITDEDITKIKKWIENSLEKLNK